MIASRRHAKAAFEHGLSLHEYQAMILEKQAPGRSTNNRTIRRSVRPERSCRIPSRSSDLMGVNENTILQIGLEAMRIQRSIAGNHVGEVRVNSDQAPTATDSLNTAILRTGAETARIQTNSSEYLWVCRREKPPLLPEPETPITETNPLRRQNGEPIKRR